MFAHKIFGKCCKTQKNNFWKFFAELVLLFGKMFYNRGTKSMRTSAMQNKAHNFPPYHIGNAPRRKLRGVSLSSRISFAGALYRKEARRARKPYFSLPCVRGEQMLSWQRHGVALTICELGNAPLFGAFPDRARSLPREKVARCPKACRGSKPEGLLSPPRPQAPCIHFSSSPSVSSSNVIENTLSIRMRL